MTAEELCDLIARTPPAYAVPPKGWEPLHTLPLRARTVDILFDNGEAVPFPVSNTAFIIDPRTPMAWKARK